MGRPSSLKPEMIQQAEKLCKLGATDADMADFFGVSEMTINNWKKAHPQFSLALKNGKAIADEQVERSLYDRACGYSHPEDKIFNNNGEEMIVPTTKHYPPDTTACIFWLKNRKPEEWRDRRELGVDGGVGPFEKFLAEDESDNSKED